MRRIRFTLTIALLVGWICSWAGENTGAAAGQEPKRLTGRVYNSDFPQGHSSFNGMLSASDGKIYYVLCSESIDTGGKMFSYDPATDKITRVGDLTEASGEKDLQAIPQGKSHVNFVESNGKLYFATHLGYYSVEDGTEKSGVAPTGYKPYPGGHFLAYDMATGKFENLAIAPPGEGIITMNMDRKRGRLYGLTWPSGNFLRYDMATRNLKNLGPTSKQGELGTGQTYRAICRSLAVDPEDGSVYLTTSDGDILRYRYERDAIEVIQEVDMRKDYFGTFDPSKPGHMGYNWRQTVWDPAEKAIYGVHGNSGYLFRFDPRVPRLDVIERITSEPSRRSGMFDKFSYGYLGFDLGPDGHTLYYLTGGAIYENGKLVVADPNVKVGVKAEENIHLVTYDLAAAKYTDHGAIFFSDGQRPADVNSIAVAKDGTVYSLSVVHENGKRRADLISIKLN